MVETRTATATKAAGRRSWRLHPAWAVAAITFLVLLASAAFRSSLSLLLVPRATNPVMFYILAALVYLCYGGAFGTMPSTAGDFFGLTNAGSIYGLMLIAWSIGGIFGPLIIAALIGPEGNYVLAYTTVGIITLVGAVLPFVTRKPKPLPTTTSAPTEAR